MNKYDYGYELKDNPTNSWAFDRISDNSVVLELGPSNGNLIYHLTNQKNCIADIVELDEESGREAARYARTACIGMEEGNLEKGFWYQKLNGNQYDYIIILDVLEHIRNPREVLCLLSSLLKKDGKILLSVPNIAHNSVLINLLQNKLEYTSVGLLDDTHVHFYTYRSILQLLKEAGLEVACSEVRQVAVNNNEIDADYGFLPREVDAYLKTREQGTAYQFLLTVSSSEANAETISEPSYKSDALYEVAAFDNAGLLILEKKINPLENVQLEIPIHSHVTKIRIDPLDTNCIISEVRLSGKDQDNNSVSLSISENTGNQFGDKYVFYDDDPQLYIDIPDNLKSVEFSCTIDVFDNGALAELAPSRDIFRQAHIDYVQVKELYEKALETAGELQLSLEKTNESNALLLAEKTQLQEEKRLLWDEKRLLWDEKRQKDTELEQANSNITKLHEKLRDTCSRMTDLSNLIEQKDGTIAALQKELQQTNESVRDLSNLIDRKDGTIAALQKELQRTNESVQDLQRKLEEANNSITEVQKELNDVLHTVWGKIYYKLNK